MDSISFAKTNVRKIDENSQTYKIIVGFTEYDHQSMRKIKGGLMEKLTIVGLVKSMFRQLNSKMHPTKFYLITYYI